MPRMRSDVRRAWQDLSASVPSDVLATRFLHAVDAAGNHRYSLAGLLCQLYLHANNADWIGPETTFGGCELHGLPTRDGNVALARPTPDVLAWARLSPATLDRIMSAEQVDLNVAAGMIATA